MSIATKLLLTLISVFALVLASSTFYQYRQESALLHTVLSEQLQDKASNYFDSLNMMMLTGTMAQKEQLRQKALTQSGIEQVRVIRGEAVNKLYGTGTTEQQAQDSIDQRALAGETIVEPINTSWGNGLVIALPMKASSDYRGTNCLGCHQAKEGEVLGVIRLEYNLSHINKLMSQSALIAVIIMSVIAIIGFMVTIMLIRKIIIKPIRQTSNFMSQVSENKELSKRLTLSQNDEIGQLGVGINSLLTTVEQSLQQVKTTSNQLVDSARRLTQVSSTTDNAASNQMQETQHVQSNIAEMQQQQQHASDATQQASQLVTETTNTIATSAQQAHSVSGEINGLVRHIDDVKQRISQLNQQTEQVSSILATIKGIAEQTNLLALNAAIESARAGEQGRGFAVVADEVRVLASRTSEATGNIENIINEFQQGSIASLQAVDDVSDSAHQRATDIEALSQAMSGAMQAMQDILNHAEQIKQQTLTTSQVSEHVQSQILMITEHANDTSQSASESRDISLELEQLSEQLERLLAQFSLSKTDT
ncbi:methyl-accepting chemotaxis protein [Motilimonas cestriensis]|uniref:methyl-accepting chemotaxis protein n=1 Tax=Motilimonas cestriensis TaxID=2742685 RepID=UPI003DA27027